MQEIKLHHLSHIAMGTSQLQQNSTGSAKSANTTAADGAASVPKDGKKSDAGENDDDNDNDDDDSDSRSGFWKKLIGSRGMEGGNDHPSTDMPQMVWFVPVVALIAVGVAITAYCSFAT
eukprot:750493-Hanusia_phi.AAC.3